MTFKEHKKYYEAVFTDITYQRKYAIEFWEAPFQNELKDKELRVIELGGYQGELAHEILRKHPNIEKWDNYEISDRADTHQVCNDPRYDPIVLEDFIWNDPPASITFKAPGASLRKYNTFVSSHTIEHITGDNFKALVDTVIRYMDYCILEAPLSEQQMPNIWKGYDGTHIQELAWNDIITILWNAGFSKFTRTGSPLKFNYFGWKEFKNGDDIILT
jgi:hypothetical protein